MEQFALASVHPRSIAWLIRLDEWERFEKIVKYNCAMIGGYFNVFILLSEQNTISKSYQRFLVDYDPDFVVLAPNMPSTQPDLSSRVHPFAFIPWESIPGIATLDPLSGGSGISATTGPKWIEMIQKSGKNIYRAFVATADEAEPSTSRLAFVACGDVEPREPMWDVIDGKIHLDANGYREEFLAKLLKSSLNQECIRAYLDEENGLVQAPNRYQLVDLISEEHQFPLSNAIGILETCFNLQHYPDAYKTFVGLTADYKNTGTPRRLVSTLEKRPPAIVVLVSEEFGLEEAVLFWNLRAGGIYVAWLSFLDLESHLDKIAIWFESEDRAMLYVISGGRDIVFSSPDEDVDRLKAIIGGLSDVRLRNNPPWYAVPRHTLEFFNYVVPSLKEERVLVSQDSSKCSFLPKLLAENKHSGMYTITLKWNGLTLPQDSSLIFTYISPETINYFPFLEMRNVSPITMPKFRIGNNHYLKVQISSEEPVTFKKPSSEKVVETLFVTGGFSRTELSSTARYHRIFLERIGGLEKSQHYLADSPYRELLELLSDNSDKRKTGWILSKPSERRALNHLQLWNALGKTIPHETKAYFDTISDLLPEEALDLLEKGILERGFVLRCTTCSYRSWYPAEHVGQTFECVRCLQAQVYRSNPLWLYKLSEVIFQGFNDNMQVPLLALHYLQRKSQQCFEWVPDSDVYWTEGDHEVKRNIDILCLCDGKFYIGEAKSNDGIERDQFSFYMDICRRVAIDGIVFATSNPQWGRATLQRIELLKTQFKGEVLVLTGRDLYPDTTAI